MVLMKAEVTGSVLTKVVSNSISNGYSNNQLAEANNRLAPLESLSETASDPFTRLEECRGGEQV